MGCQSRWVSKQKDTKKRILKRPRLDLGEIEYLGLRDGDQASEIRRMWVCGI